METPEEKKDRVPANRIAGRQPSGYPPQPIRLGGRRPKWALITIGALVLSLVAFVSGVKMGKALSDLKQGEGSPTRVLEEPKLPPFYSETKKEDPRSRKEASRFLAEVEENKIVKEQPAVIPPPRNSPEKIVRLPEKVIPPPPEKKESLPASKNKYTLQIAAFNNAEEARELVNQLKKKGYPAYQISGNAPSKGTLHRVRIGQFPSLQEAKQFALNFERKEKIKALITSL
jgi:cell division protein FtsN